MSSNRIVIECFKGQRPFSVKNLKTDGLKLFSYALKIAEWKDGEIVVYDYTSSGEFVSMTTSQHVGLIKRASNHVLVNPNEVFNGI